MNGDEITLFQTRLHDHEITTRLYIPCIEQLLCICFSPAETKIMGGGDFSRSVQFKNN